MLTNKLTVNSRLGLSIPSANTAIYTSQLTARTHTPTVPYSTHLISGIRRRLRTLLIQCTICATVRPVLSASSLFCARDGYGCSVVNACMER